MPTPMDYNPELGKLSSTRTVFIETGWKDDKLKAFLKTHPDACIFNTLSHNPISEEKVMIDGEPYIDQFGLNVYIKSEVDWYYHPDVDERFNYEQYPEEELVPELYDYFDR